MVATPAGAQGQEAPCAGYIYPGYVYIYHMHTHVCRERAVRNVMYVILILAQFSMHYIFLYFGISDGEN